MRRVHKRLRHLLTDARGTELVEAAFVTPLLLLLTFSIVDFGSILYCYLALENGVSQATRFAVTGNVMPGLSRVDSIKTAMRNATPTLTIPDEAFSFTHMPAGGSGWTGGAGGPGDVGKVTVTYTWTGITPLLRPLFPGGRVTMRVESAMKNESLWEE
jgi:hypothetical protein